MKHIALITEKPKLSGKTSTPDGAINGTFLPLIYLYKTRELFFFVTGATGITIWTTSSVNVLFSMISLRFAMQHPVRNLRGNFDSMIHERGSRRPTLFRCFDIFTFRIHRHLAGSRHIAGKV